jgi:VanZ family protein
MLRHWRVILATMLLCYWAVIFTITHLPPRHVPHVNVSDKIEHFVGYGGLATLLYATLWAYRPHFRYSALFVIAVAMCYGAADEMLQTLVGRKADVRDWIADVAGATLAAIVMTLLRQLAWRRAIAREQDAWKVRDTVRERLATDSATASS